MENFNSHFIKFKTFMRCAWRETYQLSSGRCFLLLECGHHVGSEKLPESLGFQRLSSSLPRTGVASPRAPETTDGPFSGPWSFCFSRALVSRAVLGACWGNSHVSAGGHTAP